MIKKVLIHAYSQLINNSRLTRLTLFTLFAHSLIFVFTIVFNAYIYVENQFNLRTSNEVITYIVNLFQFQNIGRVAFAVALFLFLGYFVLGPMGECAIIHQLHHKAKFSKSLTFSFENFHHIAKFEWMVFMFNIVIFINLLSKVFLYDVNNILVFTLMSMRFLMVAFVTLLFQYSKTIIVLEELSVFESIKKSIRLSLENLKTTAKFVAISLIFSVRLVLNIVFIIGVPVAAIVLLQMIGATWSLADAVVYVLFFWLLFFLAYINTLIEWYFRIYRYFAYLSIIWDTEKLENFGILKKNYGGLFELQGKYTDEDVELLSVLK